MAGPSSEKTSSQETPLAPPPSLPPEKPSSAHQPKSEPLKVKCVKCGSLDALPVRTLSRLTKGAENGRREMLMIIFDGTCVRDIPLCSGCFMHAKGCFAFRSRLHMVKRLTWSTKTNEDAIQVEECFRCFDTEFARHVQRLKDADELINYVRGLEKPSTGKLPVPDSLERLLKERSPQRSCPTPPKDYPVQIPDLLALKKASESYVAALGRTGEASEQRRRITQLQNGLLDDFMRLPPIRYSQGQAATNAAVSDPTPIYCGICEWCRTILARPASPGLTFSDWEFV
ncbi:hypothetical protein NEUTE1DRAFT_52512 [Neurospora tetrasperma FGSC 2508]|uniref:Uncharacterized protein n=1 Tax=Neurospora tetrasperma (strain FGSC 2508 / ATCC MYA-4615 / P0657) TaxID=510951 RepID=F8N2X5_NEUT8|nr:uncharacterized protein NEUTE1DRAFT_52512 [Neurospora tetrasperma FGSC 2508]EGO51689.1 hypothetical protein NEUTE1DRAFT_52512 [Neurospora tetrasperma FGSC 2508]EGZ68698.1 hypothetical protein NEUTE2DRAFT_76073 [Neurospora tetrasperma FGSC 2509]